MFYVSAWNKFPPHRTTVTAIFGEDVRAKGPLRREIASRSKPRCLESKCQMSLDGRRSRTTQSMLRFGVTHKKKTVTEHSKIMVIISKRARESPSPAVTEWNGPNGRFSGRKKVRRAWKKGSPSPTTCVPCVGKLGEFQCWFRAARSAVWTVDLCRLQFEEKNPKFSLKLGYFTLKS